MMAGPEVTEESKDGTTIANGVSERIPLQERHAPSSRPVQSSIDIPESTEGREERDGAILTTAAAPQKRPYRREIGKMVSAVFVLLFGSQMNFFLLCVIHDIIPTTPLPDLFFMIVPQQAWAWPVGDVLIAIISSVAMILLAFHEYRWIVFRRAFVIIGILYGMRAACLAVTFLPPSFHERAEICLPQINSTDPITILRRYGSYLSTLGMTSYTSEDGELILCGDLMFSGHTMVFCVMYFLILHYSPPKAGLLRWTMMPICYIGILTVVLSGGHYTIDVLIGYWLSSHFFWAYHQAFEAPRPRLHAPLRHVWWYWACAWFETNVPEGRLPNRLNWPLPWPQCFINWTNQLSNYLNNPD